MESLRAQLHSRWQLVPSLDVADDRGTHASPLGDLVVLVAAGDVLLPDALARLALEADLDPLCDVFYTDEEQESTGGRAPQRFLKPDWSPELLLSMPYVLHCLGLRRDLFLQLGGLDSQSDEAAVHAFALRATTSARGIAHLPRVLCRRPAAIDVELDAGLGVVAEAAARLAPPARAASGFEPGTYRLVRRRRGRPPVTLVVISRDPVTHIHGRGELRILANFLTSIVERSTYPDYQVLVADDGELSEETLVAMSLVGARRVSIPRFAGPQEAFNFSRKVNFALEQIETEHFVLLNDDLEVITPEWIEALMDYAVIPDVGAVGAHLVFADGLTQHAGVIAGGPDGPTHRFYMLPQDAVDDHGPAKVVRDFSAVTAAVLASRREVVAAAGPFDEALALNYNDVDFCLRVRRRGYRVVYTPFSRLYHFEHASSGLSHPSAAELALFRERWGTWCWNDPYYRRPY